VARIYVSSTFSDLADYRKEVSLALRRLGHEDIAMEYYVAEDRRPLDRCLEDVVSCDVYVGIFAWRYGYIPDSGNPEGLSITELEYRHAVTTGKTCLIFLVSDEAPWPPAKMERGVLGRVDALRQDLASRHEVGLFENVDDLARKVSEAVIRWEKQTGQVVKREPADWDTYRLAVSDRHQWVRLQVIAGASKDRGPLKIPVIEVFEPQLVVQGASGTGVPDEIRKYQQEIYGVRPSETDKGEPVDAEAEAEGEHVLSGDPEEVLNILSQERTQVILGGPGSGKSTLLQYAMLIACADSDGSTGVLPDIQIRPIPFLVELRNYVLGRDTDFISHIARRSDEFYAVGLDAQSIGNVLGQAGKALVFFDGLDEVFDSNERRRVIDQFQAFAKRYPGAGIIVTSRIAGYDPTSLGLAGFEHYTLMPLTLAHIRSFAERWYRHYTLEGTERTAQGLVQRIVESPRLLDLAGNPLLLTMMAVIYKDRDLPNERWRLYERCAETLLEDWDLGKGIENEDFKLAVVMRTAQKSELLQRVAMYMLEHSHGGRTGSELNAIAYAPLLGIFADYLEEKYLRSRGEAEAIAVDILRHLMERTYVLAGIGERIFGFVHRTFMEYFAACHCQAQFNARKSDFTWLTQGIFGAHWQEPEWEEVLLLLIAMLHDQGTPVRDVVEHLRHHVEGIDPFSVAFAARCLGEAGDVQDLEQARALLGELASAIRTCAYPRNQKTEFMGDGLKSFAALAPLLPDSADIAQEVIAWLTNSSIASCRTTGWQMGFALQPGKERLPYALAALGDPEEAVRRGAITALEREWPGRTDIGPALAHVVGTDRHARVRLAALAAIRRSWRREPAILDAIASRVVEETAYTFVIAVIEYLGSAWPKNSLALDLIVRLAAPKSRPRSGYVHVEVANVAARVVADAWAGDGRGLEFLCGLAYAGSELKTGETAIQAIADGWPGDAKAREFLQELATSHQGPRTRVAAFRALVYPIFAYTRRSTLPLETDAFYRALKTLHEGVDSPSSSIRLAAVDLFSKFFDPGSTPGLPSLRGKYSDILARVEDRAINDPEISVRVAALESLAWLVSPLWREDFDPIYAQVSAFLEENRQMILECATFCLKESDREAALWALADSCTSNPQILMFLRERVAKDRSSMVRVSAVRAVAWGWGWGVNSKAQIFLADLAMAHPDPEVRTVAADACSHLANGRHERYFHGGIYKANVPVPG
jgi:HEAT repeat protein